MEDKKEDIDLKLIKYTQEGLPVTKTPYKDIGIAIGISEEEVIQRLKNLLETGKIRRLAASIAHRKIGINANAMCVWKVSDERVDEVGKIMAKFEEVTHCYERPTYSDWEYNVFTMIHGYTDEECEAVIAAIKKQTGLNDCVILYSEKEFKKVGVRI
ncbi:heme biosynthesis protein related to NirL and NirH [Candidatus Kuenenia stuttgartiensis]|jgi:DNA-binding Lrp family transcriptional regulator|uniref:siroheme decarboxylase n=1 Tax=Kuenenia stuttgartiensis TaxID=174633 RepID=Q1PXI1_KUEST|nr:MULTISPECIES: siroheme decarboxylase subunit beta [Kuenenia]MBE7547948.1 Lrp/AsnC family transcriptional regulator [Planctomycetia bacterium]MBW7941185.1 Lrp/AsnC family transcriptional regulator [Candidatus Kuenenia stuttgartiensis]MBZ0192931.1 Lrp/AsnC family transcriptional regulator [Candidatus Kuenenia stuttgartiensis]MCF6151877.1 Lrp/AsnC family transcriptional regulator [Candidatus Kuenenia stuttgartiensis]MCL4727243.1 Lrp/AsnC family transcriptional regulator [Candidatus Kuenenia st